MNLLTNEKTILSSNGNTTILTNMRLHTSEKSWGQSYSNTIFLENISSVEIRYKSNIAFIAVGGLFLVGWFYQAMFAYSSSGATFLFVVALLFFLLYWFTRRFVVLVTPDGGKSINIIMGNVKTEFPDNFVDKIQLAKMQRLSEMYKLQSIAYSGANDEYNNH